MRRLGVAAGLGVALGCTSSSVFICEGDHECGGGRCEPNAYCSFPDATCASGWAYGELSAPSLAGTCVEQGAGTGPGSDGTGGPSDPSGTTNGPTGSPTSDVTGSPTSVSTTDVAEASSEPGTNDYGVEATGYVPHWCGEYADLISLCYDEQAGLDALSTCQQSYEAYDAQGEACLYAFDDYLACLSSLDCGDLPYSDRLCYEDLQSFELNCRPVR